MFGKLEYPSARKDDVIDDFFGKQVQDPYRWLEDADSEETIAWTQNQADFAEEMLSSLSGHEHFKARLTEVWDYPKYGMPRQSGTRLFFTKNDGLQAQPTLYVQESDGEVRVLIDPNTLSDDGTVALVDWQPTSDGRYLMYALSESGLDWRTFKIRDVDTGEDLDDVLTNIKFSSASWRKDQSGFYYSRFPDDVSDAGEGNQAVSHQLFFHRLGTSQADDSFIYEHPDLTGVNLSAQVTHDDKYLIVYVSGDSFVFNRLYYREIGNDGDFIRLYDALDASYAYVFNDDGIFYLVTTKNAPNKRVVAVDLNNPSEMKDIIPESDDVIQGVTVANNQFVVTYMHHAHHIVKVFDKDGTFAHDIDLPSIGSTMAWAGYLSNAEDTEIFIPFTSYLQPLNILKYDFKSGTLSPFFEASAPSFDADQYETKQVFFTSKDGTTVPIFITMKKGITLNDDNPTILYGYGGYDVSLSPGYASHIPVWLENGGIYAVTNLRGGGEYGEKWHLDGMLDKKQNTFDDFIGAAEYLIENGYTSSEKLAIEGGSNGGLLVAACMVQRPDLYGAVLCHVPVIDMLRFQHFTAGRYWTSEYGDANKAEDHFKFLMAYSPLHNIQAGIDYPPLLIMTADHDDRVVPMHSKKFAAALQAANADSNIILLRIDTKAGHGMGKPTAKVIDQKVDVYAFLNSLFGMGVQ
ncbi:MAG: prolyl oligopeptidase family serine peptidase [Phototrophicaceae bacterium]